MLAIVSAFGHNQVKEFEKMTNTNYLNLAEVKQTLAISVYANYGAGLIEKQGTIIAILPTYDGESNYAIIEWDGDFDDDGNYTAPHREGRYFNTIHEPGWRDCNGSGIGVFFDRGNH